MTLKEIAKLSGVSVSTVSRIVNKVTPAAASAEVEARVWKIINETGYTPNKFAKALKTGTLQNESIRQIACLFGRPADTEDNSFFSNLSKSIQKEAFSNGFTIKYTFSANEIDENLKKNLKNDNIEAIVVLGRFDSVTQSFLQKYFKYIVYVGLNQLDILYDQIICDGQMAGYIATEFLVNLHHKHIAYIGEMNNEKRFKGYYNALLDHHIPYNKNYIANVFATTKNGYDATCELLTKEKDITAIFCMNDITAVGVIKAVKDLGLKCPKDISIISIDNIEIASYISPMLTTINIPIDEMSKHAIKTLSDRMDRGHKLPITLTLPFNLLKRESHKSIQN